MSEYSEGRSAYYEDKTIGDNPYEEGTTESDYWEEGYVDAEDEALYAYDDCDCSSCCPGLYEDQETEEDQL